MVPPPAPARESFTPRNPFHRRRRRRAPSAAPLNPGLLVTSVTVAGDSPLHVVVTFSAPVETDASLPDNFLCAVSGGSLVPPADVLDSGTNWIELLFLSDVEAGAAWRIDGPLAGITPAVAWPQSGVVG